MRVLGIDPGKTGGFALIDEDAAPGGILIEPVPTHADIIDLAECRRLFKAWEPTHAFIERVHAFPKGGVSGMFNFGDSFGQMKGLCAGLGIPFTLVIPKSWQKIAHAGVEKLENPKAMSAVAASRIWPMMNFLESDRCKKPHEGMVDAALIAYYGLKYLKAGGQLL